jgi:hypothetical protein
VLLEFNERFTGERMPVAHRHYYPGIETGPELALQRSGLPLGMLENRRTSPDLGVMAAHVTCPRTSDQTRQGPAGYGGEREVDNIRVAEQVVKKLRADITDEDESTPSRRGLASGHFSASPQPL